MQFDLNPSSISITSGISLFTAIKNRRENFEEALQTWVLQKEIDEIIIVDWDSAESLAPLVEKYQNGKIYLAVVRDQQKWILSYAYNLSARLTSKTRLLKIDADVKILPGFFSNHDLQHGRFFCGNWRKRRNDNEMHLNGMIYMHRDDFFKVNGYNEFIKFYGWDDSDLYQRLEAVGLQRFDFDLDTLYHIPHANRTGFQDKHACLRNIPEDELASFATFVNRHLGNTYGKWTPDHTMLNFSITKLDDHLFQCSQAAEDVNTVSQEQLRGSEMVAVQERLALIDVDLPFELLELLTREELIELYNLSFLKKTDPFAGLLYNIILKVKPLLKSGS